MQSEMRLDRPATVQGETQILHLKQSLSLDVHGSPTRGTFARAMETEGLSFGHGDPQIQRFDAVDDKVGISFSQACHILVRRSSGRDKSIIRIEDDTHPKGFPLG